jgi:hypothetical protein
MKCPCVEVYMFRVSRCPYVIMSMSQDVRVSRSQCIDIPSGGDVCASSLFSLCRDVRVPSCPFAELSVPGCLFVVMTVCRGVPASRGPCAKVNTQCVYLVVHVRVYLSKGPTRR